MGKVPSGSTSNTIGINNTPGKHFQKVVLFVLLLVPNSAILAGHEYDLRRVPENAVSLKLGHVGRLAKPVHGFWH